MSAIVRAFDRQLGETFLETVPRAPGVYRFLDREGTVVYVGKAVNLRRRLSQYRNAKRLKKHWKMRAIVKSAASLTFEACGTELEAELREAELIAQLRPKWNVAGAFSFMYPSIGLGHGARREAVLAYSTTPSERADLAWHGAYRSRDITGEAFFALVRLLALIGHREPPERRARGARTYVFTIRQLPAGWMDEWTAFLRGESRAALSRLVLALLDKPRARRGAAEVQADVDALERFFRHEALRLREACRATGETRWPVPQEARDTVFIRARSLKRDGGSQAAAPSDR
ncbi:MAG: GIY-YIG nuclease family protein [Sandaracinus sp.]